MKHNNLKILYVIFIPLIFAFFLVPSSIAKGPKKVAILPFTMNADRDLTFLQEGIMDMISSRLAWKGMVEVLEKGFVKRTVDQFKGPLNREKALIIGKSLQVDYVILGSLTVFGESVSIDARILDVGKSEELITAFNQSKGMDEVIPTVNQFSQDVNAKIMGRVVRPQVAAVEPEIPKGPKALITTEGQVGDYAKAIYRKRFDFEIIGLDTGDVDGDGKKELVFIDRDTVYVYKWQNNTFTQFKTVKGSWSPNYIYVSVADQDGNGREEIYVSNLTELTVSSLVLEWQGNRFVEIANKQPWFFRVIHMPGQGKTLIGQKRAAYAAYVGPVHLLKREGKSFVPAGSLKLPRFGNVYNFAFVYFPGTQKRYTVMLSPYERLQLFDPHEEQVWESGEFFGGSLAYILDKDIDQADIENPGKWHFIPPPIFLTDVDEDGQQEVVICQNKSKELRITEKLRAFSSGKVHFMIWDGEGLSTRWTSQKLAGAVVGYRVDDLDHDGTPELAIAAVTQPRLLFGKSRSQLVLYELK